MQANMAARVAKLADGKDAKPLSLASVLACWKAAVRDERKPTQPAMLARPWRLRCGGPRPPGAPPPRFVMTGIKRAGLTRKACGFKPSVHSCLYVIRDGRPKPRPTSSALAHGAFAEKNSWAQRRDLRHAATRFGAETYSTQVGSSCQMPRRGHIRAAPTEQPTPAPHRPRGSPYTIIAVKFMIVVAHHSF